MTYLHASPPRVACPEHGVRQARLPWAEPHSRFMLFERLAIDVLSACDVASAAKLLRVNWDEAWHLMDRAVARGLAAGAHSVPTHLGVDEKAAGKGHDYITVVSDLDAATVEYIADERRQASLDGYFSEVQRRATRRDRRGRHGHVGTVRVLGRLALPRRRRGQIVFGPLPPDALSDHRRGHRPQTGEPGLDGRRRQKPGRLKVPGCIRGEPPRRRDRFAAFTART